MLRPEKIERFYVQVTRREPSLGSNDDVGERDFPYDDTKHTISHETDHMGRADMGPLQAREADEREIREWLRIAEISVAGVEIDGLTTIFHLNPASLTVSEIEEGDEGGDGGFGECAFIDESAPDTYDALVKAGRIKPGENALKTAYESLRRWDTR